MRNLAILASAVVVVASFVACGNPQGANSAVFAPSDASTATSGIVGTTAKGGGGKPSGGGTTESGGSLLLVQQGPSCPYDPMQPSFHSPTGNGSPNWGDVISWNISQTATTEPHVDLNCSQNGALVMTATTGLFASYPWPWTKYMTLASTRWATGGASCTATLYYFGSKSNVVLATLNFSVAP